MEIRTKNSRYMTIKQQYDEGKKANSKEVRIAKP